MRKSSPQADIFPQRLRAARTKRNLSQQDLAKRANLQASSISHFATGTRKPCFDNLRRLADALDVTTDYLLGRVNEEQALAHSSDRLYRDLDQLSAAAREMAEVFLRVLADKANKPKAEKDE